ncbi:MAG: hypothetical protein U0231_09350 [Nitrospiraceae bacterium]
MGVRFHALLLASSMAIPSSSYASKNESLMDLLGQRERLVRLQEVSGED